MSVVIVCVCVCVCVSLSASLSLSLSVSAVPRCEAQTSIEMQRMDQWPQACAHLHAAKKHLHHAHTHIR